MLPFVRLNGLWPSFCYNRLSCHACKIALLVLILAGATAADRVLEQLSHVIEDKGWYGPEESRYVPEHGRRQLLSKPVFHLGEAKLATAFLPQSDSSSPGKYDQATWDAEQSDPLKRARKRCRQTRGRWCGQYDRQPLVPAKPPPRGSKECKNNCNNVGNCHYDLGKCECPAGWTGDDCTTPFKRPCSAGTQRPANDTRPLSHIDENGRDLDWHAPGWTASRCAGICDADLAQCYCDGKYGRIPAPPGSPPGTPPLQHGRPLSEFFAKPLTDKDGKKLGWGNVPYKLIYGENGYCNADKPSEENRVDYCQIDGLTGHFCDDVIEAYCPNQCSGHGECNVGFCKCAAGWYGTDCSRKRAGEALKPSEAEGTKPWLKASGMGSLPASAADPPVVSTRKRPLIYVYDSPPAYTTRMLQYRLVWRTCIWRRFKQGNESALHDWLYGIETYFHDMLLISPHRTFDPEEADFFYVPIYVTCYFWPIAGWTDTPWWYAPTAIPRPMHGANMMLELKRWLEDTFPYWKRRGGRDHIWLTAADEGACWLPKEVYDNSIILTHWGRMDLNHTSNTAFSRDNYSHPHQEPVYQPVDWREIIKGHACYDPKKDLVIPSLKPPSHYRYSPLLGHEPLHRDILMYFRGDVGDHREARYSRGIRQKLYKLHLQQRWRDKHRILLGTSEELPGEYSEHLARSIFGLVAPGDGWSARAEDVVLHGCIPVVIMDSVDAVFESLLDWSSFSVRIQEKQIEHLPEVLLSIPQEQVVRMQRRLTQVWHRFAYATGKLYQDAISQEIKDNAHKHPPSSSSLSSSYPIQRIKQYPVQDDAFSTIMQWLYSRVPDTR